MFPDTTAATARVLQRNGCEVVIPRSQGCCGAIHYHSGIEKPAIETSPGANIAAFNPDEFDAIIVNVAGCGAMLKEYAPPAARGPTTTPPAGSSPRSATSPSILDRAGPDSPRTTPCRSPSPTTTPATSATPSRFAAQPRQLLGADPRPPPKLLPLAESEVCCGAAGTYNLTQPEMSERLGLRKMAHLAATGADVVATGNVGCLLQIARKVKERGSAMKVVHPVDLLDRAYRGERG